MAPYKALYCRRCRTPTCWSKVGDTELFGSNSAQETTEQIKMIRDHLKKAQDRQKSYYDLKHWPLDFEEGDHVFLKLSPLRKYVADPSHVVQPNDVEIQENLKTPIGPLRILERDEKRLRNKFILMDKVQ
ncbi:uncharacterized protein LOC133295440 [Gastrolobium bilobum]|uniref:uncharacterized protein LOC133295440 n=1 Tax=Gastrolobium bilobum TaxID=150636 RepID=UPI002AAFE727|nr:uncharacterized protein LOC133295440 [Gastrolobium bilobum]